MKNKMMRLASLFMVAVLLTTSVVSGTYAKYVTKAEGGDSARVAKWGVLLSVTSDIFTETYADESDPFTTVAVKADEKVIAPGTTGDAVEFSISGTPEVDFKLEVVLDGLSMVTLPMADGPFIDYTTANTTDTFTLTQDYHPVKWSLSKDTTPLTGYQNVDLATINDYFTSTTGLSGEYNVENPTELAEIAGDYVLSWEWPFEQGYDHADTYLGQIAAGKASQGNAVLTETFTLKITATQLN